MKVCTFFILIWIATLFSCEPRSTRSRSIPLQKLEKETFTTVDTALIDSVDKVSDK